MSALFPWAPFRSTKAAVKLHTLLDLRGNIPTFLHISDGKLNDVNILDQLIIAAGAFYVVDRGYLDFTRLARIDQAGAFFVTRARRRLRFRCRLSRPTDRSTGVICDQSIELTVFYSRQGYAKALRRIRFKDPETGKTLVFLTNHFDLPALTICRDDVTFFAHIRGGGLDLIQWNYQEPTNQTMSEATNVRRYTGSAGSAAR